MFTFENIKIPLQTDSEGIHWKFKKKWWQVI